MNPVTIIAIVVVVLLTVIIFGLTWIAYSSCIKAYRAEVDQGKHDEDIYKEYHTKKKCKGGLIGVICSYAALLALIGVLITGIVYRANNESFVVNNETVLVIKSGSMSKFYDEERAQYYNHDASLQFGVGDICVFETKFEKVEGEVYGYQLGDIIITHRLVAMDAERDLYQFCGDANPFADAAVHGSQIKYHYTGRRVPGLGVIILYAQSYFGLWSLFGVVGIVASSEVVYYEITAIHKRRYKELEVTL